MRPFFAGLVIFLALLAAVEIALAALDPWGLHYFDDLRAMYTRLVGDELRGYRLLDGDYTFRNWQATMRQGTRLAPDTDARATCQGVMLGDSVTFGYGVDDADTWVNRVAARLSGVQLLNSGTVGYNSGNVLGTLRAFPEADAYFYFVTENDAEPQMDITTMREQASRARESSWIWRYLSFAHERNNWQLPEPDFERFFAELDEILANGRVALAAYGDRELTLEMVRRGYPVSVIPMITDFISFVDRHPNAAGHQAMAEQLAPVVENLAGAFCQNTA